MRLRLSFLVIFLAHLALCAEGRAQTHAPACPSITVESKIKNPAWAIISAGACPGAPVTFTAAVSGVDLKEKYTFYWTVSAGEIVEGQGTSSITVSTDEADGASVTATAELVGLSGLKSECDKTAQATVQVAVCCLPPCPTLSIQCPTDLTQPGAPVTVSANVSGGDPNAEVKYKWEVSAGEIVDGQGTPTIKVSPHDAAGQSVTATVEVEGVPPECDRTESCTLPIIEYLPRSRLHDEYGDLSRALEDERLSRFGVQLQQEPGAEGYIFYFGPRDISGRLSRAQKFVASKFGIEPGRLAGVNGGYREYFVVELWIRPTGAPVPEPKPRR